MDDKASKSGKKLLGAINFRQLVNSFEESINEEIDALNQDNDNNFNQSETSAKPKEVALTINASDTVQNVVENIDKRSPFHGLTHKLASKYKFFAFLASVSKYVVARARVFSVLVGISAEVLMIYSDAIKGSVLRRMFWGRGSLFKFSAQFAIVLLIAIVLLVNTYNSSGIKFNPKVYSSVGTTAVQAAALPAVQGTSSDLLLQNNVANAPVIKERATKDFTKYTVKVGDTLSTIAEDVNKDRDEVDKVSVESILWANNLSNEREIKPGSELNIPPGKGLSVKVGSGDTVQTIAKKYSAYENDIVEFNWLDYPFTLTEGQEIFIPNGVKPEEPRPVVARVNPSLVGTSATQPYTPPSTIPSAVRFLSSWPTGGGSVSRCASGYHPAIDIAAPAGTPILAAGSGVVSFAGCAASCPAIGSVWGGSGLAWTVTIDHGNGLFTMYSHLMNFAVSSGQSVGAGEVIGYMGATGYATGAHLHFSVISGPSAFGTQRNPAPYMVNPSYCY